MKVLDHGYVRFIECWGSDERIVEAARMSTQKGFLGWGDPRHCKWCDAVTDIAGGVPKTRCPQGRGGGHEFITSDGPHPEPGDEKLLRYLMTNRHDTPFEMAGLIIEVQAPIFVFREWHRHRTQSYNEMSARYAPLPDVNYVPTVERLMLGGGHLTKQAAGTGAALDRTGAQAFIENIGRVYDVAQREYERALAAGVPKELARIGLPVGRYSRMRASANLRNWLAFLTLRHDAKAQWEIQQFAGVVSDFVAQIFPRSHALYVERKTQGAP